MKRVWHGPFWQDGFRDIKEIRIKEHETNQNNLGSDPDMGSFGNNILPH